MPTVQPSAFSPRPASSAVRSRRRWAVIAGVLAFIAVDLVLVLLAARSTQAPVPPSSEPAATVTQTVVGH